jgi:hypothetical protein
VQLLKSERLLVYFIGLASCKQAICFPRLLSWSVNDLQRLQSLFIISFGCCLCLIKKLSGKNIQRQREQDYAVIKVQSKAAWHFIRETEFRDLLIGETICRTDINTITDELAKVFGQPEFEVILIS